jgi:hypothetical protein
VEVEVEVEVARLAALGEKASAPIEPIAPTAALDSTVEISYTFCYKTQHDRINLLIIKAIILWHEYCLIATRSSSPK